MKIKVLVIFFQLFTFLFVNAQNKVLLFIGSYTDEKPDTGIYVYTFDTKTGALQKTGFVANITNPSFLTISPNGRYLYACTDTRLPNAGNIAGYKIDSILGKVTFINKQSCGGENAVYVTVYKNNKFLVSAHYTSGTASVLTMNDDGSLNPMVQFLSFTGSSIIKDRQEKPHIHSCVFSPDYQYIYLPDLGSDKVWAFRFNPSNPKPMQKADNLIVNTTPGSGPRHFTFHPNKKFAYLAEELGGTISAYRYQNGKLDSIQRIFSYSKKYNSYGTADIHISPDGKFLYASNRLNNENTISIFSIDQKTGKLTLAGHQSTYGDHPRNFTIDPSGNFLLVANMLTNNIVVFKRDAKTGLLKKTGTEIKVFKPSCLQMRVYHK